MFGRLYKDATPNVQPNSGARNHHIPTGVLSVSDRTASQRLVRDAPNRYASPILPPRHQPLSPQLLHGIGGSLDVFPQQHLVLGILLEVAKESGRQLACRSRLLRRAQFIHDRAA